MKTRKTQVCFVILLLAWAGFAWTQESKLPDFTVPQGMVRRDFPLGFADVATVEQLCRDTLTPQGGKFFVFKTTRKLLVIGRPEEVEAVRQMLPLLNQPPVNVKIEFISRAVSDDSLRGFQVSGGGRGRVGNIVIDGGIPRSPIYRRGPGDPGDLSRPVTPSGVTITGRRGVGAIDIDVLNQRTGVSNLASHFILVQSGREGFIEVARDVPMIDYFTRFVADGSFGAVLGIVPSVMGNPNLLVLAGGHFEVPQIRWEKDGTRLLVQPVVEGQLIHLTIMPQISAVTIVDPGVFRARGLNTFLAGREQYVTYTELATKVTVQSGQEVTIGGFENAAPEFGRFFFGATASTSTSYGTFTVRATIQ